MFHVESVGMWLTDRIHRSYMPMGEGRPTVGAPPPPACIAFYWVYGACPQSPLLNSMYPVEKFSIYEVKQLYLFATQPRKV
jgi:hypothetical protein